MKKCLQCHKMNDNNANFCTDCGTDLSQVESIESNSTDEKIEEVVTDESTSSDSEKIINTERLKEASSEYFDQVQAYTKENKSSLLKISMIVMVIIFAVFMISEYPQEFLTTVLIGAFIGILWVVVEHMKSEGKQSGAVGQAENNATSTQYSQQSSASELKLSRGGYGFGYVYVVRILGIISAILFFILTSGFQEQVEYLIQYGLLRDYGSQPSGFAVVIAFLIRFIIAGCIYTLFDIGIKLFENIARIARANDEIARILQEQNKPKH